VMEVLVCLASRPGESLSKETLIKAVWPHTFVSDDALIRCVSELRRVFEDDARSPLVIQTIPKRGYRLVAPVEQMRAPVVLPASPVGRKRKLWLGVGVGAVLITVAALSAYSYFHTKPAPFQQIEISQLTGNGKVKLAAISPDGSYVGYVTDEGSANPYFGLGGGGKESLWLRQAAGGNDVQVAPAGDVDYKQLTFSHDGQSLYAIRQERQYPNGVLYKIPLLGGAEKRLIADLGDVLAFSPDGSKMAFLRFSRGRSDLVIANEDGSGERVLAECKSPPFFCDNGVAWSPNSGTIATNAFWGATGSGRMSLLEFSVQDGSEHSLTKNRWAWLGNLTWLPDGRSLIVNATDLTSTRPQIFLTNIDGQLRQLTTDTNEYIGVSLTADSRTLATVQFKPSFDAWVSSAANATNAKPITSGGNSEGVTWTVKGKIVFQKIMGPGEMSIWMMESDGSRARPLTPTAGRINMFPRPSPDGRFIVFVSDRTGSAHLWRMDLDGNNPTQLTNGSEDYLAFGFDFTSDGKWVVFTRMGADEGLWKVSINGGEPTRLSTSRAVYYPAISPNGKMLAYYSPGEHAVRVIGLDGKGPARQFDIPFGTIRWTQDSRSLLYIKNQSDVSNLWSQSISGGPAKQITHFNSLLIAQFDLSRDGKELVMSRGISNRDVVLIRDVR